MKYAKYVIAVIFYIIAIVLMISTGAGDSFYADMRLLISEPQEIHVEELAKIAKENHVLLYTYDRIPLSLDDYTYDYYSAADDQVELQRKLGIKDGIIRDLLMNQTQVRFKTFENDMTPEITQNLYMWYILGERENCHLFSVHVKNKLHYHIKAEEANDNYETYIPFVVFAILLIMILFYCYIETSMQKKEIAIRVIHGDTPLYHYIKTSFTDTIIFSTIFLIGAIIQKQYTQIYNPISNIYWLLIPFFILLWLLNLHLLYINPKEIVFGHQRSEKLMWLMSGLSVVTAILACLFITASIPMFPTMAHYHKGSDYFTKHRDYYFAYVRLNASEEKELLDDPNNIHLQNQRDFLKENNTELQPIIIQLEQDYSQNVQPIWQMLYSNYRALSYFHTVIPESEQVDLQKYEVAFLIPQTLPATERQKAMQYLLNQFELYEGYRPNEVHIQIIDFCPQTEIMYLTSTLTSHFSFADMPVICIASDTYARSDVDKLIINHVHCMQYMMFKSENPEHLQELYHYTGTIVSSNAYDLFMHDYYLQLTYLVITIVMFFLVLAFYILVQYTILYLDYQIHAKELAICKTLGYSIYQNNHRQFDLAEIAALFNIALSCFLVFQMHYSTYLIVIGVSVLMLLLNYTMIYIMIRKIEKQKLTKILKGGAL